MSRVLLTVAIAVAAAAAMLLLPMASDLNQIFPLQVLAQSNNATAATSITTNNITGLTPPRQTVVHRGIISSEEPAHLVLRPGEENHGVEILPHRQDGATYTGILTFTATKPVEVGFGHRLHIDNSTLSQFDTETLGDLYKRHHVDSKEHATPGIISVPSRITPDYGTSPPYFSASIPFAGSSVFLTTAGDPFVAVYEVVAEILQPQIVVDVESANINETNTTSASS
jgi:hypothetical protein